MLDISEIVSKALEDATREELEGIVEHGVKLPDSDMLEALENEFHTQAKDMLNTKVLDKPEVKIKSRKILVEDESYLHREMVKGLKTRL